MTPLRSATATHDAPAIPAPDFSFRTSRGGFTMIEIALCLAVIGFALIAIIGVLPIGMNVQKENRWETVVDEDAFVWMNALRGGGRGYDDLTNFVVSITNTVTTLAGGPNSAPTGTPKVYSYTRFGSWMDSTPTTPLVPLTYGSNIVGVLSTPRITSVTFGNQTTWYSNHVAAYVRGMSGPAHEKYPQNNSNVLDTAFMYRMIPDITSYVPIDTNSINIPTDPQGNPIFGPAFNRARLVSYLERNSSDIRLTFRWPVIANGDIGNYRQSFRTFVGGPPASVATNPKDPTQPILYYYQPAIYQPPTFQP